MKGLQFDIEGIHFCCFRQPASTSVILSYSIPPFTTIRGLIECALGMQRDSYFLQEQIKIGLKPLNKPEKVTELARILKFISRQKEQVFYKNFPSAPMFRSFLVAPQYRIFIVGDPELIDMIAQKLKTPERPCYLGQSDDMIDISNIKMQPVQEKKSCSISSIIEGIHEDCEIIRVPYQFINNGSDIEMKVLSIPQKFPYNLKEEISCVSFNDENISIY
jgi:CRISPR-associated protein Cas5h